MNSSYFHKAFFSSFLALFIAGSVLSFLFASFTKVDGIHLLAFFAASGIITLSLALLNLFYFLSTTSHLVKLLLPGIVGILLFSILFFKERSFLLFLGLPFFNLGLGLYWIFKFKKEH